MSAGGEGQPQGGAMWGVDRGGGGAETGARSPKGGSPRRMTGCRPTKLGVAQESVPRALSGEVELGFVVPGGSGPRFSLDSELCYAESGQRSGDPRFGLRASPSNPPLVDLIRIGPQHTYPKQP